MHRREPHPYREASPPGVAVSPISPPSGRRGCRRWWRLYHGVMVQRAEDLEAVRKPVACITLAPYQAAALDQLRPRALRERFD